MIDIKVKVEVIEKETVKIYRMSSLDLQGKPVMWTSAFLIDGLLIDCGHHHAKKQFLDVLNLDDVETCVLSHHHEDHTGAASDLMITHGIPVYSNAETAFLTRIKVRITPERLFTWGVPKPAKVKILPNLKQIKTSRATFKIIPSPGHCNNLISFFHVEKKFLFSTDAIIDKKQSVIFNWEDADQIFTTFKRLEKLNPKYVFSSNSSFFTNDDLKGLIKYWKKIKEMSIDLHDKGVKPRNIVKEIFGKESWLKKTTRGDLCRENLIRSLLKLPTLSNRRTYKSEL